MILRSLGVLRGLLGSMRRVFGTTLEWSWRVGRLKGSLLGGLWIAQGCPKAMTIIDPDQVNRVAGPWAPPKL